MLEKGLLVNVLTRPGDLVLLYRKVAEREAETKENEKGK